MAYLLDTNVFIQPYKTFYDPSICPGYWAWLDRARGAYRVLSITQVRDEVRDEPLVEWVSERKALFVPTDGSVLESLRLTLQKLMGTGQYDERATRAYASVADAYLVAHAHAYQHTVVTFEVREPLRRTKVKIPDACDVVDVECIDPYEMLRREGIRFELAS